MNATTTTTVTATADANANFSRWLAYVDSIRQTYLIEQDENLFDEAAWLASALIARVMSAEARGTARALFSACAREAGVSEVDAVLEMSAEELAARAPLYGADFLAALENQRHLALRWRAYLEAGAPYVSSRTLVVLGDLEF